MEKLWKQNLVAKYVRSNLVVENVIAVNENSENYFFNSMLSLEMAQTLKFARDNINELFRLKVSSN